MTTFTITNTVHGATWHRVVDPAVATIERALAAGQRDVGSASRTPAQIAISKAATAWSGARTTLDQIPPVLEALPGKIVTARLVPDFTNQARKRLVDEAIDSTRQEVERLGEKLRGQLDRVDTILRTASLPPRPGDSVADEAKIAAAKIDAKMVLDAEDPDPSNLAHRVAELAQRAIGDGDQHTAWVLTGSRWPADYIRTQNRLLSESQIVEVVGAEVGLVLDQASGTDFAAARHAYRQVVSVDGIWAIESAAGMLPSLLEAVRDWTQSHSQ